MVSTKAKNFLRIALIAVPIILVLAFVLKVVVTPLLFDRPELALAKGFIETNEVVNGLVGQVKATELDDRNSKVSIMPDRTEGYYDFRVEGENTTEKLRVTWVYFKGEPPRFRADGLWLLRSGKTAERIWP